MRILSPFFSYQFDIHCLATANPSPQPHAHTYFSQKDFCFELKLHLLHCIFVSSCMFQYSQNQFRNASKVFTLKTLMNRQKMFVDILEMTHVYMSRYTLNFLCPDSFPVEFSQTSNVTQGITSPKTLNLINIALLYNEFLKFVLIIEVQTSAGNNFPFLLIQ